MYLGVEARYVRWHLYGFIAHQFCTTPEILGENVPNPVGGGGGGGGEFFCGRMFSLVLGISWENLLQITQF